MERDDELFDLSIQLPSIEGIESTCEDELQLLMKEVNLAFRRKHRDLLQEVTQLKASNLEKSTIIESLNAKLRKAQNNKQLEDKVKNLSKEIEKLKDENSRLKSENTLAQKRTHSTSEINKLKESLKRGMAIQEENVLLKERFDKLSEKHSILHENYQKIRNLMTSESKEQQEEDSSALDEFIQRFIAQESENFIQEEIGHCDELLSKVHKEIDEFQKTLQESS